MGVRQHRDGESESKSEQEDAAGVRREIQLEAGTVEVREDGILHVVLAEQAGVTAEDAQALQTAALEACEVPRPVLADIRRARGVNILSMRHSAGKDAFEMTTRLAFLVGSPVSRMIGSLFLGLWKAPCPTRMFTDEAAAVAWLLASSAEEEIEDGERERNRGGGHVQDDPDASGHGSAA
jgi:hypothetical protein